MKVNLAIQRFIILIIFYFLISVRGDGYFPFSENSDHNILLLFQIFVVLISFFLLILFFQNKILISSKLFEFIKRHLILLFPLFTLFLIIITDLYFLKNYLNFKNYYNFNYLVVIILSVISIIFIFYCVYSRKTILTIISIFNSSFLLSLIPLIYFPINSKIGDLIPIIQKQLEAFLTGQNIYQFFLLDNGVLTQAVRQPGTTLSYLPAYLLNIDLRFMGIFFTFLTCFFLLKLIYKNFNEIKFDSKFLLILTLISIILLSPYRLNRLDVYEPVFWFLLTLTIYFLKTKKLALASLTFGIGIFTQVWFWLFFPFFIYYIFKKYTLNKTLKCISIIIISGVLPLSLFIFRDFSAYYQNVFGYYNNLVSFNEFNLSSFYLTPLIIQSGLKKLLLFIQVVSSGIILFGFIRSRINIKTLLMYLGLVFFIFIQFNSLTWNYMYLDIFVLLIIYLFLNLKIDEQF